MGATALLAETSSLGYTGSHNLLVRYLNQGRHLDDHPHLSPRRAARLLLTRPENLTEGQRERRKVFDLHDRLPGITAPTLVVGGGRDACYGRELLERTAALLPHGTVLIHPRNGHMGVQNRRVAREILAFLDQTVTSTPT